MNDLNMQKGNMQQNGASFAHDNEATKNKQSQHGFLMKT